ncbi:MAG: bifunctional folylpolyglutamate synthase/dihydrofolate synthase [Thermoanaerobaculia bacterium]|nr:bifunctional folylpolyglutamate synthase/dihydrofolate synthase [Thermoanaerobaculia bacterium]
MAARSVAAILAELEPLGVRLGLDAFRRLLAALGSPENVAPAVLVAGTNGKGSVAALLEAIARAAGLRTGLYTSPHLAAFGERIRVAGVDIDESSLAARLETTLAAARGAALPPPTVFEALTAAAFLSFAAARVELAVLEVGLGGRLDATNAAEPILSVITRIGFDHRAELGETLAAIAGEKAGILRRGVAAVVAGQPAEAAAALVSAAARLGARLHRVDDETALESAEWRGLAGHRLRLRSPSARYDLDLALAGEHQLENAATAVRAAELLAERFPAIDRAAIARGVATVRWPGRLEAFRLPTGGATVLLDAAHNPDGCRALARFLARLGRPYDLLFGCLADKEAGDMLPPLAAAAHRVVLTRPDSPRALAPERLSTLMPASIPVEILPEPPSALNRAIAGGSGLVVVAGSIYLVGRLRASLVDGGAVPAA